MNDPASTENASAILKDNYGSPVSDALSRRRKKLAETMGVSKTKEEIERETENDE